MGYKVITAVTAEPVSLPEAKLHLRLDDIGGSHPHDSLISALITSAREFAEHATGRAMARQTLELALGEFPDVIKLPLPPVASITSITYTDTAGAAQTLATDQYALSLYGDAREISRAYGVTWPSTQAIQDAVRVRYLTGYETAPKAAKQAILLQIELDYTGNQFAPAERESRERARDALLGTVRLWGF